MGRTRLVPLLAVTGGAYLALCSCAPTTDDHSATAGSAGAAALRSSDVTVEPYALAKRAVGRVVPARANDPNRAPRLNGFPEHLLFSLDADRVPDEADISQRQVRVFPLMPYAERFAGADRATFDDKVSTLRSLIRQKPSRVTTDIPIFPPVEAAPVFHAQIRPLAFGGGAGLRFLTRYAREGGSTNESLLYVFEGVTDDGRFLVSVFYPVGLRGLPATPITERTVKYLETQPNARFSPPLDLIDSLVQSVRLR